MFTPEQLSELRSRLRHSHTETSLLGHDWDVADVLSVLEAYQRDLIIDLRFKDRSSIPT